MSIDPVLIEGDRYVGAPLAPNNSRATPRASNRAAVPPVTDPKTTSPAEETIALESITLADELAEAIGLGLTRNNPVWTSAALDRIRELQHVLMKCAFSLPQVDRGPVLGGVKALEISVALRLRLDEAMYAEQQTAMRGSAPVESKEPSGAGKSEVPNNRAIAA